MSGSCKYQSADDCHDRLISCLVDKMSQNCEIKKTFFFFQKLKITSSNVLLFYHNPKDIQLEFWLLLEKTK